MKAAAGNIAAVVAALGAAYFVGQQVEAVFEEIANEIAALEAEARVSNNAMPRNRLAFGYQFFDQILAERYNETAFGGDLYNKHMEMRDGTKQSV